MMALAREDIRGEIENRTKKAVSIHVMMALAREGLIHIFIENA